MPVQQLLSVYRNTTTTGAETWARLLLRVAVGALLAVHGFQGLADPANRVETATALGVPFPAVTSWLSIAGEILSSLGVLAGCLTAVASSGMAVLMGITWLTSSLGRPLLGDGPGLTHENSLFFALGAATILLLGPGRLSIDAWLARRRETTSV